ncbi:MAG: ribokinase [Eubacterium sp.]|nr:ribokinase [Eubacterium sp.]
MKVLNFGSMNLDYVYSVDHFIIPGETESSSKMEIFPGGKGLNQSIALARAGVAISHAGMIGEDGGMLREVLEKSGVDVSLIRSIPGRGGHTIIQLDKSGQNGILLYGGSNRAITKEYVDEVFSRYTEGDLVLLQNEISELPYIVSKASEKGMQIALNPSPFDEKLDAVAMAKVSYFFINEIEGAQLTGQKDPDLILSEMAKRYPAAKVVLTLGGSGAAYLCEGRVYRHPIYKVPVVDTTAAGDTFTGYFLSAVIEDRTPDECLEIASKASALAVSRQGAAPSIPWRKEVEEFR